MKAGTEVKLTKVSAEVEIEGMLVVEHTLKGHLLLDLEKGAPLYVSRYERNGEAVEGLFRSTPIQMLNWDGDKRAYAHTQNSTWRVELVE